MNPDITTKRNSNGQVRTVIKIGGSLLRSSPAAKAAFPDNKFVLEKSLADPTLTENLRSRPGPAEHGVSRNCVNELKAWIRRLPRSGQRYWVVVGGGEAADRVRQQQVEEGFDDCEAHWRAIETMRRQATEFAQNFGLDIERIDRKWLESDASCTTGPEGDGNYPSEGSLSVAILADDILDVPQLPPSWDTTSDSIALWFSTQVRANSLILAKRVNPLEPVMAACKIRGLGWIDPQFCRLWASCQDWSSGRMPQFWIRHFGCGLSMGPPHLDEVLNDGLGRGTAARLWTCLEAGKLG